MAACLTAAVGAGSAAVASALTAAAAWLGRHALLNMMSDQEVMLALQARGVDLEHHAMENFIERNYTRVDKLGEGASGVVWRVRDQTGEELAMKVVRKRGCGPHGPGKGESYHPSKEEEESLETEIRCLRKLKHRHIVNLVEAVESERTLWIIMECADGGGLYDRIISMDHFSEAVASRLIKQVLRAVHYMHSNGVVHRDLKPENVLLQSKDPESDVKVADFGLAVELGFEGFHPEESMRLKNSKQIRGGFCGSPISMAPEVASKNAQYGPQCDMWSVGCMSHELLSGEPPFTAKNAKELFRLIKESPGPRFTNKVWPTLSDASKDIIRKMLARDPVNRPSAREALHHPWFEMATEHHLEDVHEMHKTRARESADDEDDELTDTWTVNKGISQFSSS